MSVRAALGLPPSEPGKHRSALELRSEVGEAAWEDAFTFAFVRNPWDRLVSWWSMIDSRRLADGAIAGGNEFYRYVWARATTFEEFVRECTDTIHDSDGSKSIVRPQLEYLIDADGRMLVDFVGRYEQIAADFAVVAACLDRPGLRLPWENRSPHAHYSEYYSDELVDLVANHYRLDVEAFGYEFDSSESLAQAS